MGRPKDTYWWDLANKLPDGKLECKYCDKKFKGGVSRIKLHLSGRGGNIGPCKNVPNEIKEKAVEELRGETSVVESSREKAVKASPMKPIRYASVGGDNTGGNVAETGEMSSLAAMAISSHNQVPKELKEKAGEERLRGDTSVGEVNRDKALKPSPMKRVRYTSVGEDGYDVNVAAMAVSSHNQVSSSSPFYDMPSWLQELQSWLPELDNAAETGETSISLGAMGISSDDPVFSSSFFHESPSNAVELVKYLISRNVDVFKDPHFWSLLTNVQSSLQHFENSAIIEESWSNFEHEMNQYMKDVKESWKTTGCTLILYDLSKGKGKLSADGRRNSVAGF